MPSPFRTISGKLIATTTAAISLLLVAATIFTGLQTYNRTQTEVLQNAQFKAREIGNEIVAELTEATAAAAALGGAITGYVEGGNAMISEVMNIMHGVPGRYDLVFSSWLAGIPGNGTDTHISGEEGQNGAGTYAPYWTKNDQGGLNFETFEFDGNTQAEWFRLPIVSRDSVITEPYLSDEGRLLTSVAVPVFANEDIIAVAGVDIVLDRLISFIQGLSAFEGGQVMLLGQGGKWLAHPDPELLTQAFEGTGADALQTAIETGQFQVVEGLESGATRMLFPFTGYGMNKTWTLVLDVPRETFIAPVKAALMKVVLISIAFLAMTLATIFFASRALVRKPMHKMLNAVTALSNGKVHDPIDLPDSKDEIGEMAGSIETLRQGLSEKDALEEEQLRERKNQEIVVSTLANGLRALAQGQLDSSIPNPLPGQYEALRVDFNNTVQRLSEIIGAIDNSAKTIQTGVAGITSASDDLSRRTETSAAQLEETAAALDEMTSTVKLVADGARQAETLVGSMKDQAATSSNVVEETVKAMDSIETSSEQISQITGVIDDIAFQTNLLALNAGVEAARAGPAGRGFAVVAAEVRGLAQRSSEAAQEIKTLILDSSTHVSHGVELVGRTNEALQSIIDAVDGISQHVGSIASQTHEQANGIVEINSAMGLLDTTQQQNAAMYEETAAACMTLDAETSSLSKLVAEFQKDSAAHEAQGAESWAAE
jgi:methyl-accepting chemotaxis protein